ncbi:dihydrodipicolinate synthase family protein [Olivibacter domesticus]|uniref:4-hydroxy-tetrahydrodipicolinate synthase n=1 Tax=Olivibacter domesticus TaxID=407022 RepID=A0A1H7H9R3_OLID1|nr:dihydrodipicolinate synthase family protein [Olivibacter domesticus]SEK45770.1 4-hydroxy-tetrahydrodipicolinate synthase [Olivibacter domesticus]
MKIKKKYHGTIVPLVTPINEKFQLDKEAINRMLENLKQFDASPFILGTTGESALLSNSLRLEYLETVSGIRSSEHKLYVGISSNSMRETIEFSKMCFDLGADAVVATLPFYYKLSENQIKEYFLQLADHVAGPMIIYNIPSTTHMSIPLDLLNELSYHEHIVGTKDSERSEERLKESLALWSDRPDFSHLLGWAAKSTYALINGSDGLVPSTGNLAPSIYQGMYQAIAEGAEEKAYQYQRQSDLLGDLYQTDRTLGESLWALKVLMQSVGLCEPYMMPPLQGLSAEEIDALKVSFRKLVKEEGIKLNIYNHV